MFVIRIPVKRSVLNTVSAAKSFVHTASPAVRGNKIWLLGASATVAASQFKAVLQLLLLAPPVHVRVTSVASRLVTVSVTSLPVPPLYEIL